MTITTITESRHFKGNEPVCKRLLNFLISMDDRWETEGLELEMIDTDKGACLCYDREVLAREDEGMMIYTANYDSWKKWQ